jgi:hypothetical protein
MQPENPGQSFAGRHTRAVLWFKEAFIWVADTLTAHTPGYRFRSAWQFDAAEVIHNIRGAHTQYDGSNLRIEAVECGTPLECKIYCGHTAPLLGYIARDGLRLGGGEAAPMLAIEGRCERGQDVALAQLLIPYSGVSPPSNACAFCAENGNYYWHIELENEAWHIVINERAMRGAGLTTQIEACGPFQCDGAAAAVRVQNEAVTYAMVLHGRTLRMDGEAYIHEATFGDYEWPYD